jgi:hypothetical protein
MKDELKQPRGPRQVDGWFVADEALPADPMARLAYYARLAPSSHNSQPWRFALGRSTIDVFADHGRWLRVADADRREMYLSLGCAIESLRIAADYAGFGTELRYFPLESDETLTARVEVAFGGPKREDAAGDLLKAMVTRRTSRRRFERSHPVSDENRKRLYRCFAIGDVSLHFVSEPAAISALAALESRADQLLLANRAYREELALWLGQGLLGPSRTLARIGALAVGHLPVAGRIGNEDAERLASAPLVAALTTRHDRRLDQVQAGQAYLRIALVAESRDIRVQPLSQLLEVAETRAAAALQFGAEDRALQHVFRLGHAEAETRAPQRRPLGSMLISA